MRRAVDSDGWELAPPERLAERGRAFEAWNRRELEPWIETFAPDCEWHPATVGSVVGETMPFRGHAGLRAFVREASEVWEYFELEAHQLLLRGRLSLALGRVRARGRASGVATETAMYWLNELNDAGETVWARAFVDLDQAFSAAEERDAADHAG